MSKMGVFNPEWALTFVRGSYRQYMQDCVPEYAVNCCLEMNELWLRKDPSDAMYQC